MEHLLNCHGEWTLLAQVLVTLPFVGVWLRAMVPARVHRHGDHGDHR